jgi:hypothetical protein
MAMPPIPCPSCGAPIVFQSAASILAVCGYCGSTLIRRDLNLETLGKMAELMADGSPLRLRTAGRYRGAGFTVVGRIQLRFDAGLWNEWHIFFDDGRNGWLGEAAGIYTVSFLTKVPEALPRINDLRSGETVVLNGRAMVVTSVGEARCIGGEGELPFAIGPGYAAPSADLADEGNRFATIDYSEDPPLVFVGEAVEFDDLHLSGLRPLNGW